MREFHPIIVVLMLICIIVLPIFTHVNAKTYYDSRIAENKCRPKVYDLMFVILPNLSTSTLVRIIVDFGVNVLFICAFVYLKTPYVKLLMYRILLMFFIRSIIINLTVLPKEKSCNDKGLTIYNYVFGHCYDKLYSGHYASVYLTSSLLYTNGIINVYIFAFINIIGALLILSARFHYTNDIVFAYFASFFVEQILTIV